MSSNNEVSKVLALCTEVEVDTNVKKDVLVQLPYSSKSHKVQKLKCSQV